MNLTGNSILITGGASGIGLALAGILLERGNNVLICARTAANLQHAKQQYPGIITYQCDLSNTEDRRAMLQEITQSGISINLLINNAATMSCNDLSGGNSDQLAIIKKDIAINLTSPIELIDELLPSLKQQKNPAIININSPAAIVPIAKIAAYSAAKAALLSYSKSLRYQLKDHNINVIDVFPPGVKTAMMDKINTGRTLISPQDFANNMIHQLQQGKEEIWVGESNIVRLLSHFSSRWLFNWANNQLTENN